MKYVVALTLTLLCCTIGYTQSFVGSINQLNYEGPRPRKLSLDGDKIYFATNNNSLYQYNFEDNTQKFIVNLGRAWEVTAFQNKVYYFSLIAGVYGEYNFNSFDIESKEITTIETFNYEPDEFGIINGPDKIEIIDGHLYLTVSELIYLRTDYIYSHFDTNSGTLHEAARPVIAQALFSEPRELSSDNGMVYSHYDKASGEHTFSRYNPLSKTLETKTISEAIPGFDPSEEFFDHNFTVVNDIFYLIKSSNYEGYNNEISPGIFAFDFNTGVLTHLLPELNISPFTMTSAQGKLIFESWIFSPDLKYIYDIDLEELTAFQGGFEHILNVFEHNDEIFIRSEEDLSKIVPSTGQVITVHDAGYALIEEDPIIVDDRFIFYSNDGQGSSDFFLYESPYICNRTNVSITSQEELDQFECFQFIGDVTISGNITNLDALTSLKTTFGRLTIKNCPNLEEINLLKNINNLRSMVIHNNESLNNLDGLTRLRHVSDQLRITENPNLETCCGLHNMYFSGSFPDEDNIILANNSASCEADDLLIACDKAESACFATEVVDYSPGKRVDGRSVRAHRQITNKALGSPQENNRQNSVSLGIGGSITLKLGDDLYDDGTDMPDFIMVETSSGLASTRCFENGTFNNPESAVVEVSDDGSNWFSLPNIQCRTSFIDIKPAVDRGMAFARYVRITDASNASQFSGRGDGYDLDGLITCSDEVVAALDRLTNARSSGGQYYDPNFINLDPDEIGSSLSLYPNPMVNDQLSIQLDAALNETASFRIMSMDGRTVWSNNIEVVSGLNTFELFLDNIKKGQYMIEIKLSDQYILEKFVK